MKYTFGRIAAYTVLYLCVIFGIFVLQFTKGQTFSLTAGAMTVTGRQERTESGETVPLLPIHIVSNGLDIYISEQNPAYAIYAERKTVPLEILSYEKNENGFSIHCSDQVIISFFSEIRGDINSLRIEATAPEAIEKVLLPWKITQNAAIERAGEKIFVRSGKKQYAFTGSFGFDAAIPDAVGQEEIPHLVLGKMQPVAYYKTYLPFEGVDIHSIPAMEQASPEQYAKAIDAFTSAVLNVGKKALAAQKITEAVLTSYLAEMGRRDMFSQALKEAPATTLPRELRTYRTNPFYNNLQTTHAGLTTADAQQRDLYTSLIAAEKPEIFEHEGIIPFLTDRGRKRSAEEFFQLVEKTDAAALTVRQAAGLLSVWLDCMRYYPEYIKLFEDFLPVCEKKLTDALLLIDEGLYVSDDGSYIGTADSITVAHILMRYGAVRDSAWQSVARMLITSLLRYSGETAGLPTGFTVSGEKTTQLGLIADDSRILDTGTLYPLVMADNNWYPHAQSLALQSEPGVWAWTCAQDIEVLENTAKTLTLRIRFPVGASHYVTLHGIRPFYRIELYGIPFRSDARFEMYNSSGYTYNASAKVLYLKMRHKNEYETIKLSLGKAPQEKPVKVSAPETVAPAATTPAVSDMGTPETAPAASSSSEEAQEEDSE